MALPIFTSFRTRTYHATTPSSNSTASVAVVARGELIKARYATTPALAHTAASNSVSVAINGTHVTGWSSRAVTTSTGDSSFDFGTLAEKNYVIAGDVLSVVVSSCAGGNMTFVVREF